MGDESGGGEGAGASGGGEVTPAVQARIDAMRQKQGEAERRAGAAEKRAAEAEAKLGEVGELRKMLEAYQGKEATWGEERAAIFAMTGTDPSSVAEGVDMARLAYGRVPADKRPAGGIGEWLKSDSVPKGVKAYFANAGGSSSSNGAPPAPKLPASNTGAVPGSPGGDTKLSVEQIAALSDEEFSKRASDLLSGKA